LPNLRAAARAEGASLADDDSRGRSRSREPTRLGDGQMEVDSEGAEGGGKARKAARSKSRTVPKDRSATRRDDASLTRSRSPSATGLRDEASLKKAEKLTRQKQFKLNKFGHASESDRRILIKKPKHLFAGKRGNGKTDRR